MIMKKLKKYYKWILIAVVIIIVSVLTFLIYKNLFSGGNSNRLDGIENYKITKKEINLVRQSLNELDYIESVDISENYKIIKIFVQLNQEIKLDEFNDVIIESINNFSKKNVEFYDIEVFVECLEEESQIYPRIGYKHKSNSEFTWNR